MPSMNEQRPSSSFHFYFLSREINVIQSILAMVYFLLYFCKVKNNKMQTIAKT